MIKSDRWIKRMALDKGMIEPVVDPKAFDARSFVDVKGDVCIIPPNSFALGRSVEYRAPQGLVLFRTRWA